MLPEVFVGHLEPINVEFEPISRHLIDELELIFGFHFPDELVEFLMRYGRCGFTEEARIDVGHECFGVFTMFGCSGESGDILDEWKNHPDYQSEGLIPIADDMFNNRYVLAKNDGQILFIDYSCNPTATSIVAPSFGDFIDRIYFLPDS